MAGPTTEPAAAAVRTLVAELESERDALADAVVERIREAVPEFRRLPRGTLRGAVQDTMGRELAALSEIRAPSDEELEGSRTIARDRAEQGMSVESVLHAHRVAVNGRYSSTLKKAKQAEQLMREIVESVRVPV